MESGTDPVKLDTIRQIAINVKDVPRATAFYLDTLGMKVPVSSAKPGVLPGTMARR